MRWVGLCLALGACGRLDFDATDDIDLGPWSPPQPATDLDPGGSVDDPSLTADLLEVYLNVNNDIWSGSRASPSEPFGALHLVAEVSSSNDETAPRISGDGLRLYFACVCPGSLGSNDVYLATRASRADSWSAPQHIGELSTTGNDEGASESGDGLTLVLYSSASGSNTLYMTTRATLGDPWPMPAPISELDGADSESNPYLSRSRLNIWFAAGTSSATLDLYTATRASTSAPFEAPTRLDTLSSPEWDDDPWVSPDGHLMYFSSTRANGSTLKIYTATR